MKRKSSSRRKKRTFITHTVRVPKWQRNLRAGVKGFKRQAMTVLAAAGFIWLLTLVAKVLGGG